MSYIGESPRSYGGLYIQLVAIDDTHVYAGGWTNPKPLKYLKK